jgi:hypothetical protein
LSLSRLEPLNSISPEPFQDFEDIICNIIYPAAGQGYPASGPGDNRMAQRRAVFSGLKLDFILTILDREDRITK